MKPYSLISSSAFLLPALYTFYTSQPIIYPLSYLLTGISFLSGSPLQKTLHVKLLNLMMMRWCLMVYIWKGRNLLFRPTFFAISITFLLFIKNCHFNARELRKMNCVASVYYFAAKYFLIMVSNMFVNYYPNMS
jgi:hypothetical protein